MLRGILDITDGPRARYDGVYSQPDGECVVQGERMVVEIKCPVSGWVPYRPSDEYYIQCQCHMEAHDMDKCLLVYYTPTCVVIYMIYRSDKVWRMVEQVMRDNRKKVREANEVNIKRGRIKKKAELDVDKWGIERSIERYIKYDKIFEWEEERGIMYEESFFGKLDVRDISQKFSIINL